MVNSPRNIMPGPPYSTSSLVVRPRTDSAVDIKNFFVVHSGIIYICQLKKLYYICLESIIEVLPRFHENRNSNWPAIRQTSNVLREQIVNSPLWHVIHTGHHSMSIVMLKFNLVDKCVGGGKTFLHVAPFLNMCRAFLLYQSEILTLLLGIRTCIFTQNMINILSSCLMLKNTIFSLHYYIQNMLYSTKLVYNVKQNGVRRFGLRFQSIMSWLFLRAQLGYFHIGPSLSSKISEREGGNYFALKS